MNVVIDGTPVSPKATSIEFAHCMDKVNIYWENMIGSLKAEGGKIMLSYEKALECYPNEVSIILENLTKIFEAEMVKYYEPLVEETII